MENKICVYAICKNEEKFVERWVKSMSEADYIVVLDTGSTDDTVEALKRYGVYVEQKIIDPWRFDVARNESLKLVPEDANILICTDLDETLDPGWADVIKKYWTPKYIRGYYKYAWSHDEAGNPGRIFAYDKLHSRGWHWDYPVHEMLVPDDPTWVCNDYNTINFFNKGVYLHHYPDPLKSRGNYLPLLEQRREEYPDDYYGLMYLAHEYTYRGFYQKAIDTFFVILDKHKDKVDMLDRASCYLFMGDDYKSLKLNGEAIKWYKKAIETDPTYREPYINLAKVLMNENQFQEAYDYLKKALDKTYRHYTWLERDNSWKEELYDIMSLAAYYSGHKLESLAYAVKASHECKTDDRLQDNIERILENMKEEDFL